MRPALATVPGAAIPYPYGGKVAPDPDRPRSRRRCRRSGLSANDVANAHRRAEPDHAGRHRRRSAASNTTSSSTTRPTTIDELNDLPIKTVGRRHHLHARRRPGARRHPAAAATSCTSTAAASVLMTDPEERLGLDARHHRRRQGQAAEPASRRCPTTLEHRAAQRPVAVREGRDLRRGQGRRDRRGADQPDDPAVPRQLALDGDHRDLDPAGRSWRAIAALSALGQTLNIMTLGGLALAVGILVDDATVTIENINWHLEQGKDVEHRDPRRRAADRDAGLRLAALHLHRLRADVLPRGRRAASCSCRWPRRWCSR